MDWDELESGMFDEQDVASERVLTRRSDAKRRRAALKTELRAAGKSLHSIGGALKNLYGNSIVNRVDYILPIIAQVSTIYDLRGVKEMLEELKELEAQLAELDRSASSVGTD